MIFSENTNLRPGGESASPSKIKELDKKIDDLSQTVTSVADSVADLADEVTTAELNATSANVTNAVIDNATVGTETATTVNATTANADTLNATDADITNLNANEIEAQSVDADNGYFGSVNAQSFTGQGINITGDITASAKVQGKTVQATEKVITPALESTETELKGKTVVRGDVQFPENGDKIYGEYLDVEANNLQAKSLTTQTPSGSSQLVGYDSNGKLIPVDASLDPANLWENDPDEEGTIRPKDEKNVKTAGIIADEGDITELNTGDLAAENLTAENATVTEDLSVEGNTTLNEATVGGDLDVDGDTTLDNTTVDGTLQVNGDIIQNGSAYETHAEKVYTKDDLIITRDGAVGALGPTEVTGIQAKKYDGTNDGQLVFNRNGEARVGDVGDTEPLMTRDELANMTDARPLVWDGTNSKAVTGSSAQADALNSGITASDVTQIGDNETAIGDLSALTTTDKTDLVSAINEVSASIGTPDVSNVTGVLPIANGGTGASTKNVAKANLGNYSGYITGGSFNSSTIALTMTTPAGANNITDGDTVIVYVLDDVKSSVAVDEVQFSFGGRTEYIDCKGTLIKSHEYTSANANYNASYPHVVFKANTVLTLMYDEDGRWHIIGNPEVDSYHDANGNGYKVYADGYIEQWGYYTNTKTSLNLSTSITLSIQYSNTDYGFFRSNLMPNSNSSTGISHGTLRGMLGYNTKTVDTVTVGVDGNSYLYGFDWGTSGY